MEKELYEYMIKKIDSLAKVGIVYSEDTIERAYISLISSLGTIEEKKQRIDDMFINVIKNKEQNDQMNNENYLKIK